MTEDAPTIGGKLARLTAWEMLHGSNAATEADFAELCRALDALEEGAGEDWQRERDARLGRAITPLR